MNRDQLVYLDYNILSSAAAVPSEPLSEEMRAGIAALLAGGFRVVLSAWHVVELARSTSITHIESCCRYVETLSPIWLSNGLFVKRKELERYLNSVSVFRRQLDPVPVFNDLYSQMWATFNGVVVVGESFCETLAAIKLPAGGTLAQVNQAMAKTPDAILTARAARDDGRVKASEPAIDRAFFGGVLGVSSTSKALDILEANKRDVLACCPTLAVEDRLTRLRMLGNFKPKPSDAADMQHALVALAYCGHFVSYDSNFLELCRQTVKAIGLPCKTHGRPGDVCKKKPAGR